LCACIFDGVKAIPELLLGLIDGTQRKGIPNHAGRRSHVTADCVIGPRSRSDKLHKRFFPRADMGNEEARPSRRPIPINGFHQFGILGKCAPDLASASGDRPLHHLRAGKQIAAEPIYVCRTDPIPLPVVQHVKVGDRHISAEEPLDHILVLVFSPYGVHRHLKRFAPVDEGLELTKWAVLA
jgi:hypothetical protein